MQREILKYLLDIQVSINSIFDYLGENRDFNHYKADKLLRRGVERELEIIGEATNRILKIDENIALSDAKRIVRLRNWVIHGYDKVDDTIIWGIVSRDVPLLKTEIEQLLNLAKI
jgi:uncharacterized protein with HEPN domain